MLLKDEDRLRRILVITVLMWIARRQRQGNPWKLTGQLAWHTYVLRKTSHVRQDGRQGGSLTTHN